jgi:hypothetical protein
MLRAAARRRNSRSSVSLRRRPPPPAVPPLSSAPRRWACSSCSTARRGAVGQPQQEQAQVLHSTAASGRLVGLLAVGG